MRMALRSSWRKPVTMSMLAIHSSAIDSKVASYHEFLTRYSKSRKVVYGFVEGKEDPAFYRGFIELLIPEDWAVELWPAGNKKQVYEIHSLLDWRKFKKKRVCFFVDQDLSALIPEKLKEDSNIYVTPQYSIENDVVRKDTFKRVLTELYGFAHLSHDDVDQIANTFERELEAFYVHLIPIMAWILTWRRAGKKAGLNDILMRDMFRFSGGILQPIANPKGKADAATYIHEQCNVAYDSTVNLMSVRGELTTGKRYRSLTRGKYLLWFIVEFCHSVHREASALFPGKPAPQKMNVTISTSNAMALIGPRARVPQSLRKFLEVNHLTYIDQIVGA
jgi:Protein of unknown function (DUF4435)